MTYKDIDIDLANTVPTRNVRSRRRALARSHRTGGTRIIGFGL